MLSAVIGQPETRSMHGAVLATLAPRKFFLLGTHPRTAEGPRRGGGAPVRPRKFRIITAGVPVAARSRPAVQFARPQASGS